ncbi:epoxyqueuosine reductase [Dethiobacter alkaliphilus]|uniref:4Fe-4S ferredoxin iron-sulfur binding domain protein n=1 Tax=Dethiobacter alkaliphilus AHT 1 TaxID=555088 RepID=C0GCC1_DETAL|nr:epoxyqueuosine reductase [Dethiobacter alkaliphilus]EEG78856.1 4Fe-4S ferredoxin iron-sulfur binding domain protein [Dethiobacter alkaliphilus AHT 1]
MKDKIREFVLGMGVDDVGFAKISDYNSPRSPKIESIFPKAQSIIVLAYKELSTCESPNMQVAMNGRLDVMEFSRSCNYKLAKFIEKELHAKAMTISVSYPLEMSHKTSGAIGDVSLRHAAVAAGLGVFGRHNLVIHPELGTRVLFTAVLTNLELPTDPPITDNFCIECNICVENCPGGALDEKSKTHVGKCLKNSQPYGLGADMAFRKKLVDSTSDEQKAMLKDEHYWRLYQAGFIGFQYSCFNCLKSCPIAQ